ncbi:MAG: hypothetical protein WKF93_11525 [Acidimicrobiales bacterium]
MTEPVDPPTAPYDTDSTLDALAADVAAMLRPSQIVPDEVVAAARGALSWRLVDTELAELLEGEALLVRDDGAGPATYAVGALTIDLERTDGTLVGQVTVAAGDNQVVAVAIDVANRVVGTIDGTVDGAVDDLGGFGAEVGTGPVRIVVELRDGRVATPWLT